jgi:hypothetical protein
VRLPRLPADRAGIPVTVGLGEPPPDGALFRFRYSALAFAAVGLGLVNSVLVVRVFGISAQADSLAVSSLVLSAVSLLPLFVTEQFLFIYNDIKSLDPESARRFYCAAATLSTIAGGLLAAALVVGGDLVIRLFASGTDPQRRSILGQLLRIQFISLLLFPVSYVNTALINAEMRFTVPYLLQLTPGMTSAVLLLTMGFGDRADVVLLAWGNVISSAAVVLLQFVTLGRMGFRYRPQLRHPWICRLIANSLPMRVGHNIRDFSVQPILANALIAMPVGYAACYSYARKLIDAIQTILIGPTLTVYRSRLSGYWTARDGRAVEREIRHFLRTAMAFVVPVVVVACVLIPEALVVLAPRSIPVSSRSTIQSLFLVLSVWLVVVAVETPFGHFLIAAQKSRVFIATNSLYVVVVLLVVGLLRRSCGVFSIPLALTAAQVLSALAYALLARRELRAARASGPARSVEVPGAGQRGDRRRSGR